MNQAEDIHLHLPLQRHYKGVPGGSAVKNLPAMRETQVQPVDQEIPWRGEWQPTLIFLPGESHGQRSLAGYSPWGGKESDTTERLSHHHHLDIYSTTLIFFRNLRGAVGLQCCGSSRCMAVMQLYRHTWISSLSSSFPTYYTIE